MAADTIEPSDLWKGIVLYGRNQATYKMALGKCLVHFAKEQRSEVSWLDLSVMFLKLYEERLLNDPKPQQDTFGRKTKLERIVGSLKQGNIDRDEAIARVASEGFVDVVPRFQTIGMDKTIASGKFYEFQMEKRLILKNDLLSIVAKDAFTLEEDINARWGLLEGAFSINQAASNLTLANDIRDIFLSSGSEKRENLTSNIPFLTSYQGNTCFYCGEPITHNTHVDHVLPRQVVNHDHIWNLVLAHDTCNLQKSDKLVGPHFIKKLVFRNENIMGSNHPWKQNIANLLGNTKTKRKETTQKYYEMVKVARGELYWGASKAYDPSTDDFYKRFVTVLNNGFQND
jgi:hypothetical protein